MAAAVTPRPLFGRPVAIAASVLLHGLLFIGFGGSISSPSPDPLNRSVTRLSFLAAAPESPPAPEKMREQPKPEKPMSAKRPDAKKVAKAAPKKVEPEPEQAVPKVVQAVSAQPQQLNEGVISRERERYLVQVMAHIEEHKWYPKAARRRGIEGEVHVRFVLFPDGSARQLKVANGPSLLLAAAKEAVEKAVPMPTPPASVHCPLECEFRMRFRLDAS